MNFKNKYRLLLYKNYFDKGAGLTYYFRYMILLFGLTTQNILTTFIFAAAYAISAFFIGWLFYKYKWMEAENEVNNNYNKFVRQVRKKINGPSFGKGRAVG